MTKTLIVSGRLKELCRTTEGKKLCTSNDLDEALTKKVELLIIDACRRATANQRTTVLPRDL